MKVVTGILLSFVLVGCLVLSACNCNSTGNDIITTTSTSTTPTPAVTGGGTLKLYGADPTTLDPALSSDANSHQYIVQIFSGLVKLGDNLEPAPDIAGTWEISQDNLTFTFYLRHDVVFQDGRQVTAADFKYSWERACNPATGSSTAGTYLIDIVGVREVIQGMAEEISGVEVINDYTLKVTIDAPKSYFLSKLSYPTAMVVDKFNVADGFKIEWIGVSDQGHALAQRYPEVGGLAENMEIREIGQENIFIAEGIGFFQA